MGGGAVSADGRPEEGTGAAGAGVGVAALDKMDAWGTKRNNEVSARKGKGREREPGMIGKRTGSICCSTGPFSSSNTRTRSRRCPITEGNGRVSAKNTRRVELDLAA